MQRATILANIYLPNMSDIHIWHSTRCRSRIWMSVVDEAIRTIIQRITFVLFGAHVRSSVLHPSIRLRNCVAIRGTLYFKNGI